MSPIASDIAFEQLWDIFGTRINPARRQYIFLEILDCHYVAQEETFALGCLQSFDGVTTGHKLWQEVVESKVINWIFYHISHPILIREKHGSDGIQHLTKPMAMGHINQEKP